MYAKGMTTRDIQAHVQELYGFEISPAMISNITEKVVEVATDWRARSLQAVYPIVFFDAIHYKVNNGKVVSKAVYTYLGIDIDGLKALPEAIRAIFPEVKSNFVLFIKLEFL